MNISWNKLLILGTFFLLTKNTQAQINTIKFATPLKDSFTTTASSVIFSGIIQQKPFGKLSINNRPVTIYNTGTFAIRIDSLIDGVNSIDANYAYKSQNSKQTFIISKTTATKPISNNGFVIESISTYPENIQWLQVGDIIQVKAKATSGSQVYCNNFLLLEENNSGIYKGNYAITNQEIGKDIKLTFTLKDSTKNEIVTKRLDSSIRILSDNPISGHTVGKLPYMNYGFGGNRLGGAKMTYLDSLVPFVVTGKIDNNYRVKLSNTQTAYIPTGNIILDQKSLAPLSTILSGNWRVEPRNDGDFISINLDSRRPYSSLTEVNPSRLLVDIYGTVSNTNWITKLQGLKVIKNIWYEQLPDNVLRVFIDLKNPQNWGYDIHYEGNNLVIFLKDAPKSSNWKDLTIALDAGHGGENLGADGLTGAYEKDITLQITNKLAKKLQLLGAKVIMTRTKDTTLSMVDRILQLKESKPEILVSLHCNSAGTPFVQGNSTYYRYIGFAPLSEYIHKEMLKLGLEDYGNVGSFNFALSGPTNYVNALNELAFISNPEDEAKLLDPIWQEKMVDATINGIHNFMKANLLNAEKSTSKRKK